MTKTPPDAKPTSRSACPICGKPARPETRPFCCRRCADVDLWRWLGGRYVVSDTESEDRPLSGDDG